MHHSILKTSLKLRTNQILLLFAILLNFSAALFAQTNTISGRVTGIDGEPLIGVNVVITGSVIGVVTDINGKFSINIPAAAKEINFSYIGYVTEKVAITNQTVLNITLLEELAKLDEVVVVGYGTQRKRDIAGAVSQVNSEKLTQVASIGLDQALQGRVAGVQVSNNSSEPGGGVSVKIRGAGSINGTCEPLYVVDGIPLSGGLNNINVADIETIDILKDAASASIYGSMAANGVVLVTTKKGKKGEISVNFESYWGFQNVTKTFDMLNTRQFMELANEAVRNARIDAGDDSIKMLLPNINWKIKPDSNYHTTNWQDEIFRTAPIRNYSVNVMGGNDKHRSSLSASYLDQDGILLGSDFTRGTIRAATDFEATSWLRFGANLSLSQYKKNSVSTDLSFRGAMQLALNALPEMPVFANEDGPLENPLYYGFDGYAFMNRYELDDRYYPQYPNPVYAVSKSTQIWEKNDDFTGLFYSELEPIKGLIFKGSLSYKNTMPESWAKNKLLPTQITKTPNDDLRHSTSSTKQYNPIFTINYTLKLEKHSLSLLAGTDFRMVDFVNFGSLAQGFPNEINVSINSATDKNAHGTYYRETFESYISRLNYSFNEKYILTTTLRADGSSKFGPGNKYGFFPSASLAWRVSNEEFLKNIDAISDFKLRVSYGVVGNDQIGRGLYYSLLRFNDVQLASPDPALKILYAFGPALKQEKVAGIEPSLLEDKNIKWEEAHEINLGADLGFFKNKLTIGLDVFKKLNYDMLAYKSVPYSFGAPGNVVFTNFASMENKGIEILVGYKNSFGKVKYSIDANYSFIKNEVINKPEESTMGLNGEIPTAKTATFEGYPIAQFYGYKTDGIYQNQKEIDGGVFAVGDPKPGDFRFKNTDGNTIIDDNDREYLGNGLPKNIFGLNLNASYSYFDCSLLIYGQYDVKAANLNKRLLYDVRDIGSSNFVNAGTDLYKNRWHGEGTSNNVPKVSYNPTPSNFYFSDFYVEDASFVRIKNIQIGFNLPKNILDKFHISKLRMYCSLQNYFTFTNYSGLDPEVGSPYGSVQLTGMDYGRYPAPKILMFGINLNL